MSAVDYRVLYDIAKTLHTQNLDWKRTLQTIVSRTCQALGVEHGCLITLDETLNVDQVFILGATSTPKQQDRAMWDILVRRGLVGYVYHSDRIVNVRNMRSDPLWPDLPEGSLLPLEGSAVGVPLGQGNPRSGVILCLHPTIDYFTQERCEFLSEVAKIASAAMTNAYELEIARKQDIRYHSIFEHTAVPIVLTDSEGLIQDANFKACEFLGFKRTTLVGLPINDINILSAEEVAMADLDLEEETYVRTSVYDIDGNKLPTLVRLRPVKVNDKVVFEWMLQDISVQMELEQLRRDLTAMVFHDLRGPLTNMQVSIHKLAEVLSKHQNPAVLKLLTLGLRSTQQLQRLVDSLLDIQRLEEGSSILNRQPTEMHPVLKNAIQLVQPLAGEASQTINFDIGPIPAIMIDSDMITRVVINLLENAVKYTPDGGKIRLVADMPEGHLIVSIIDSGPGIPEDMRNRIFDKFSRIRHQDAPKGVGLGLNFCKLAVEAHGGRIWVESDGKNGSSFKFALPAIFPDGDKRSDSMDKQEVAASA